MFLYDLPIRNGNFTFRTMSLILSSSDSWKISNFSITLFPTTIASQVVCSRDTVKSFMVFSLIFLDVICSGSRLEQFTFSIEIRHGK